MAKSGQDKVVSLATTEPTMKRGIGHWGRVAVMVLSCGFIFPHAMTESDDIVINPIVDTVATVKS